MKARDIQHLRTLTSLDLLTTGEVIAAVSSPDLVSDQNVSLLRAFAPGAEPAGRLVTRGPRDTSVRVSPDGRLIGFLRSAPSSALSDDVEASYEVAPQLHLMDARGGEAFTVTDLPLGVRDFVWLPDSTGLVVQAPVPEAERYRADIGAALEPPRRLPATHGRLNGRGYVYDRPDHLFFVPVPALHEDPAFEASARASERGLSARPLGQATRMTEGPAAFTLLDITADDRYALALSRQHEGWEQDLREDLFAVPLKDFGDGLDEPTRLTGAPDRSGPAYGIEDACMSADGALWLLASPLGQDGLDFVAAPCSVYRVGPERAHALLAGQDAPLFACEDTTPSPLTDGRVEVIAPLVAHETPGGSAVIFGVAERGAVRCAALSPDGDLTFYTPGTAVATAWSARGGQLAVALADATSAGDVWCVREGEAERLSDLSVGLRRSGLIRPIERVYSGPTSARDCTPYPVHGWVLLPERGGPHPVLLMIHGGPHSAYTPAVFDEAQVLAEAGYAVVMCNPRGSAGYGSAHGRAVKEALGTVDMSDVLAFLSGALEEFEDLDAARLGVMGGSYGGYLTAFIIGHDHRFSAAIVERGYLDPTTFVGPSDIGWFFSEQYVGTDPQAVARQSPMTYLDEVRTPVLVVHSEEDLRCPLDQALRYYVELRQRGAIAEALIFPGENHELSRSGSPLHRLDRFEAILEWWARYLPVGLEGP
ncbi:MAG: alpha/beta fold hydrolase [Bowdeniella nasicola]|nr:alpha/beta fold hydrolase [Bowdeniella nasicola]